MSFDVARALWSAAPPPTALSLTARAAQLMTEDRSLDVLGAMRRAGIVLADDRARRTDRRPSSFYTSPLGRP